jgi:hypothetical protein
MSTLIIVFPISSSKIALLMRVPFEMTRLPVYRLAPYNGTHKTQYEYSYCGLEGMVFGFIKARSPPITSVQELN